MYYKKFNKQAMVTELNRMAGAGYDIESTYGDVLRINVSKIDNNVHEKIKLLCNNEDFNENIKNCKLSSHNNYAYHSDTHQTHQDLLVFNRATLSMCGYNNAVFEASERCNKKTLTTIKKLEKFIQTVTKTIDDMSNLTILDANITNMIYNMIKFTDLFQSLYRDIYDFKDFKIKLTRRSLGKFNACALDVQSINSNIFTRFEFQLNYSLKKDIFLKIAGLSGVQDYAENAWKNYSAISEDRRNISTYIDLRHDGSEYVYYSNNLIEYSKLFSKSLNEEADFLRSVIDSYDLKEKMITKIKALSNKFCDRHMYNVFSRSYYSTPDVPLLILNNNDQFEEKSLKLLEILSKSNKRFIKELNKNSSISKVQAKILLIK